MQDNLHLFVGYSLVDITATGVTRGAESTERNQQRNWETVLQCISLRTQPLNIQKPEAMDVDNVRKLDFGDFYEGPQRVWMWSWTTEPSEVYDLPGRPFAGLLTDFEQVPVVTYLTETARFMLPIFYPYGSIKNIYFKQVTPSINTI